MPANNRRRIINEDTPIFEDEDVSNYVTEDPQDIDEQEEIPEAFIPQFQVAPDEIPLESQVHIPTEDEQKATVENVYKKLGIKAKQLLNEPPQPMTPEKERFIGRTSSMGAKIFSSVTMWGFSIFGYEYGLLAPTVEQSQKMIEPAARIWARHSKFVGSISPDVDDLVDCMTAMSDYAVTAMALMQQIREDKAINNGRFTGATFAYQARPSNTGIRSNNNGGFTTDASEVTRQNGDINSGSTDNLTGYEQYNRDRLYELTQRDLAYRARRSGRI